MADRRQVRYNLKRMQRIKTWQLLILLLLAGFVAATFLRLNNIGMEQRRDAVQQADKIGDENAIKGRLFDLQRYVTAHMNTSMGSIYLQNEYQRDTQQVIDTASDDNPNGNIYKKAQDVCAPRFTHYTYAYLQCTVDYLSQYKPATNSDSVVKIPSTNAYRFSFESPLWSADFAGFSVLLCVLIVLMIFGRLTGVIILKILLKKRNR